MSDLQDVLIHSIEMQAEILDKKNQKCSSKFNKLVSAMRDFLHEKDEYDELIDKFDKTCHVLSENGECGEKEEEETD